MKRMQDIDFTKAYGNPPPSFEQRVQYALRQTEEEEQIVKKTSLRVILLTALIIAVMTTAAFAASQMMNWSDFFRRYRQVGIPQAAVDEMQQTESMTWEVGPLTFTVQELLTDGHIALSSTTIRTTDGSPALITCDFEHVNPIGARGKVTQALADRLGMDTGMTWMEAAKQLDIPLYSAQAMMKAPFEYSGTAMFDAMWNEDNSMTFFCMAYLDKGMPEETLPVAFHLRSGLIDTTTGESAQSWVDYDHSATLSISPMLEERTYTTDVESCLLGFTFDRLEAKQYVTGAYMDLFFTAPEGAKRDDAAPLYNLNLTDAAGTPLPHGINLSLDMDRSEWPQVILKMMVGTETLPESIAITDGDHSIIVK